MTTVVTRGAASAQALGYASSSAAVNYIEDVFSTYLYTGNGSTQTITNGIDLSGKGGLVWLKERSPSTTPHKLYDTIRGAAVALQSNTTGPNSSPDAGVTAFNSNGFSIDNSNFTSNVNNATYVSWTFREQPKFFDIVTYTGNGATGARAIAHALGSAPGCVIVKQTSGGGGAWAVYHRGLDATVPQDYTILLNSTAARLNYTVGLDNWGRTQPTSTNFYVSYDTGGYPGNTNSSGETYVAYLFAHDAGGFGLTGTDNVISCGSYVGNGTGSGPIVTLGYEPQWIMVKDITTSGQDWVMQDVMRGMTITSGEGVYLRANSAVADAANSYFNPFATGFQPNQSSGQANASGRTYIYVAIRRGPMKVPTDATKVFKPVLVTSSAADQNVDAGFPVDLVGIGWRNAALGVYFVDRLRGITSSTTPRLAPPSTAAEQLTNNISGAYQTGVTQYTGGSTGYDFVDWFFRRAPGFFDEVCYTGTGVTAAYTHNLGVAPELLILKKRNAVWDWRVYVASLGNTNVLYLNDTAAVSGTSGWNNTTPTSTQFTVSSGYNTTSDTYVAYLFATVAGVSKVGSYTGTGTTQVINCGFTAGARFVLIKRTDSTGDWYVWDSARGIVAGNDPYLLLNSTAAEVTGTDYVDTAASGFEISSTAPAAINANGGSFIFLAIA